MLILARHLLTTNTNDWDLQFKSKAEFLARTESSELSSYSSTTLSTDSDDVEIDLQERTCSFWDDVGLQTFEPVQGEPLAQRKLFPLSMWVTSVLLYSLFIWVLANVVHACRTQPQHQHQRRCGKHCQLRRFR